MNQRFREALGDRLRVARLDSVGTLAHLERSSGGRWKAMTVGSYERGQRNINVMTLAELADFYRVSVASLIPDYWDLVDVEATPARPYEDVPLW